MDPVLQWQSHITDSTDREVILGNLDLLQQFAGAINGGDKYTISDGQSQVTGSLSAQFEDIRTKIKNGTIKPTEWKDSAQFVNITKAVTNASSGKIAGLGERLGTAEGNITSHGKALSNYGKRIKDAEGDITSHTETLSGYGERLDTAEETLTSHTTALGNKLDSSIFEKFKTGDFKTITDWKSDLDKKLPSLASATDLDDLDKRLNNIKILLNNEVSHWTADKKPLPQSYTAIDKVKSSTQPWGTGEDPERHADDLCTVIGEKQPDKGVSYRFVKHPTEDTYKWTKVIDNDGALALSQHSQFVTTYNKDKEKLDEDSKNKQSSIDALKKRLGFQDGDPNKSVKEFLEEQREKWRGAESQYKVVVSTKGSIKDGKIIGGESVNGTPVIVHTAHVYTITGKSVTNNIADKLTWTINKGRTTKPVEKTVTGLVCKVSQDQFVNDGTNPHYYDVELNSTF